MNLFDLTTSVVPPEFTAETSAKLNEWLAVIEPVIQAACGHNIRNHDINAVFLTEKALYISTTYTSLGRDEIMDTSIPIHILKAKNPVLAAKEYRIAKMLKTVKSQLDASVQQVTYHSKNVAKLEEELATLTAQMKSEEEGNAALHHPVRKRNT